MSTAATLTFRRATLADLPSLAALGDEVNAVHHEALPDVFAPPVPGRDEAHWRDAIGADDAHVAFVAESDGTLVGFVTGRVSDEASPMFVPMLLCHVGTLGVAAAMRGRGIGHALMALLEGWARERGAVEMHLNVWRFNGGAARLYAELGYEERSAFMARRL